MARLSFTVLFALLAMLLAVANTAPLDERDPQRGRFGLGRARPAAAARPAAPAVGRFGRNRGQAKAAQAGGAGGAAAAAGRKNALARFGKNRGQAKAAGAGNANAAGGANNAAAAAAARFRGRFGRKGKGQAAQAGNANANANNANANANAGAADAAAASANNAAANAAAAQAAAAQASGANCNQARAGFISQLSNAQAALTTIVNDQDPTDNAAAQLITDVQNSIALAQTGVDNIKSALTSGQQPATSDNDKVLQGLNSAASAVRQIKADTNAALAQDIATFRTAVTAAQAFASKSAAVCAAA